MQTTPARARSVAVAAQIHARNIGFPDVEGSNGGAVLPILSHTRECARRVPSRLEML
jgi:hypothetical protein